MCHCLSCRGMHVSRGTSPPTPPRPPYLLDLVEPDSVQCRDRSSGTVVLDDAGEGWADSLAASKSVAVG